MKRQYIGSMGLVGYEKRTIKINIYFAIVFFVLMSIGVVCLVSWAIDTAERIYHARIVSGITDGIKDSKGKFSIPNSNIYIIPKTKDTGKLVIAGAGDEGMRKTWEGGN